MTARETSIAFRNEFAEELEGLERELATVQAASAADEAAYEAALAEWRELQQFVCRGVDAGVDGEIAGPLHGRLELERREKLREASGRRGAKRALISSLTERIDARRLSIAQLDRALTADKVVSLPTQEPSRRKPAPVEFDTIVMPREVKR